MFERREQRGRIVCLRAENEERVRWSVRGRDHSGESEVEEGEGRTALVRTREGYRRVAVYTPGLLTSRGVQA